MGHTLDGAKLRKIPDPLLESGSSSEQIDAIIKKYADWRGRRLSELRVLVRRADPAIVEEVKWKSLVIRVGSRSGLTMG